MKDSLGPFSAANVVMQTLWHKDAAACDVLRSTEKLLGDSAPSYPAVRLAVRELKAAKLVCVTDVSGTVKTLSLTASGRRLARSHRSLLRRMAEGR